MRVWLCLVFLSCICFFVSARRRDPPPPPPPPPPPGPPPPPPGPPGAPPPPGGKPATPRKNYIKWNWDTDNFDAKGTIFSSLAVPELTDPFFDAQFTAKAGKTLGSSPSDKPKPAVPTILDSKRAYLVGIIAKKLKMTPAKIKGEVEKILSSGKVTNEDQFRQLLAVLPTEEEAKKAVKEKDPTPFSEVDQIAIALSAIPRVYDKMSAVKNMSDFTQALPTLTSSLQKIEDGMKAIAASQRLVDVVKVAMAIGLKANGVKKDGFRLHSLLNLKDGRSPTTPQLTYLHYLVAVLQSKYPDALNLDKDLVKLETDLETRRKSVADDVGDLKVAFSELKKLKTNRDPSDNSPFYPLLDQFLTDKEKSLTDLVSRNTAVNQLYDETLKKLGLDKGKADPGTTLIKLAADLKKAAGDLTAGKKPGPIDLTKAAVESSSGTGTGTGTGSGSGSGSRSGSGSGPRSGSGSGPGSLTRSGSLSGSGSGSGPRSGSGSGSGPRSGSGSGSGSNSGGANKPRGPFFGIPRNQKKRFHHI